MVFSSVVFSSVLRSPTSSYTGEEGRGGTTNWALVNCKETRMRKTKRGIFFIVFVLLLPKVPKAFRTEKLGLFSSLFCSARTLNSFCPKNPCLFRFNTYLSKLNSTFGAFSAPVVASKSAALSKPRRRAMKTVGMRETRIFQVFATPL